MSAESPGRKSGFKSFFSNVLRPKKSRQTLRKGDSRSTTDLRQAVRPSLDDAPPVPSLAPLQLHRLKYQATHANLDYNLGERRDYTTIIHSIGCLEMDDSTGPADIFDPNRAPGEGDIAKLSSSLWAQIAWYLDPASAASLAFSSITLYRRLRTLVLEEPQNHDFKMQFLIGLDISLPHHLLCFQCGRYHRRTQEGAERIRPAQVLNPLFKCPEATNVLNPQARTRITHGRTLAFPFVQLATRAHRYGPRYGIPVEDMGRRWHKDGWSHASRFFIHEGRLLMRVTSQAFAAPSLPPSSMRMLLFSRDDYWPYFSACAHWRDGELMSVCKCALGHIPAPRDTGGLQGLEYKVKDRWVGQRFDPNSLTLLCGFCRPMRRCPECPSEYLTEVKLCEDKSDPHKLVFRQAIVVTRWTDLGDGTTPSGLEWGAINGKRDDYDSFQHYAKRGIASVFEAAFTADTLPGQRVLSMNPQKKKLGEEGDSWY
ncbi:uncharacterized protein N7477_008475 [Penicillium maclennaniae]|uniref:uncharacterized protein n=1 Tax=Penicillium maclennaniae TaxID=1343394 RepID=UPI0025406913|nr:uncharacterized protein N7477_008475 [Penicillium maclennaniae]KAJ5666027.1 hypothetical protein N7477_008475 [Penicillium maclennaniae]